MDDIEEFDSDDHINIEDDELFNGMVIKLNQVSDTVCLWAYGPQYGPLLYEPLLQTDTTLFNIQCKKVQRTKQVK